MAMHDRLRRTLETDQALLTKVEAAFPNPHLTMQSNDTGPRPMTDLGNAERLVVRHGADLKFCKALGWLVWDGTRWCEDDTEEVYRRAKETVRQIYVEAAGEQDSALRNALAKWARKSESREKIVAMVQLARWQPGISIRIAQLDTHIFLLNCENGTIDLRSGKLCPHRREDLITKLAPVEYSAGATCPRFKRFLLEIFSSGAPGACNRLIEYMQRAIGYSLTGDTSEELLHVLYGTGANGKTTLVKLIGAMLGNYSKQSEFSTFLVDRHDRIRNDIARLARSRFVSTPEIENKRQLSEAIIKTLTGRDTVTARFLFREFFEFEPQFKLFFVANDKPRISGTDHAIWRRVRLVPFLVRIPVKRQDKKLMHKLLKELPGILAWCVRGCLRWQRNGLTAPEEVALATEEYRRDVDYIQQFITERCIIEKSSLVTCAALHDAYLGWARESGVGLLNPREFGIWLAEYGFTPGRTGKARFWRGIRLRHE
jgi:putative DNA primase/helicase